VKAFKTYGAARKHANGGPVIRVGYIYIAAPERDLSDLGMTSIELLNSSGGITGGVTLKHLERLGNANWATANSRYGYSGSEKVFGAQYGAAPERSPLGGIRITMPLKD
jgi:hypothetical protein